MARKYDGALTAALDHKPLQAIVDNNLEILMQKMFLLQKAI